MGYKTCHILKSSLDATICAKDCDTLRNKFFAKRCKERGGLYKCCIRRDAAFCHECRYLIWYIIINGKKITHHLQRFCCTLSLCTYPAGANVQTDPLDPNDPQDPNRKSYSVFDDKVGCFSPIVFIVAMTLCKYECMILSHDGSKILTACRMLQISIAQRQMKAKIHSFPTMYITFIRLWD